MWGSKVLCNVFLGEIHQMWRWHVCSTRLARSAVAGLGLSQCAGLVAMASIFSSTLCQAAKQVFYGKVLSINGQDFTWHGGKTASI